MAARARLCSNPTILKDHDMRRLLTGMLLAGLIGSGTAAGLGATAATAAPYTAVFRTFVTASGPAVVAAGSTATIAIRTGAAGSNLKPGGGTVSATFSKSGGGSYTVSTSARGSSGTARVTSGPLTKGSWSVSVTYTPANKRFSASSTSTRIVARTLHTKVRTPKFDRTAERGERSTYRFKISKPTKVKAAGRFIVRVVKVGGGQRYRLVSKVRPNGTVRIKTRPFKQVGRYKVIVKFVPAPGSGLPATRTVKFVNVSA